MPHENFMVMVSHLVYPAYEKVPASVSRVFMTNVLRKEWQYKGIIITDDMAMGGLANVYAPEEMGVLAIDAGADMLLSCNPPMTPAIYQSVLAAVKNGDISQQRIDESVYRILSAKEILGIWQLDEASGIK
jgi:beta-N-acetylhexosaminidase